MRAMALLVMTAESNAKFADTTLLGPPPIEDDFVQELTGRGREATAGMKGRLLRPVLSLYEGKLKALDAAQTANEQRQNFVSRFADKLERVLQS